MLGAFLVFVLGVFLGCAPGDEGATNAPSTTAQRNETSARTAEEASNAKPPPNIAEAAAAGIDEASIRTHLARLTGASPAPLESGAVTIA